jgi:hypothetical protein
MKGPVVLALVVAVAVLGCIAWGRLDGWATRRELRTWCARHGHPATAGFTCVCGDVWRLEEASA